MLDAALGSAAPPLDVDGEGGHEALIILAPVLVGLLCLVIVLVTVLGRRRLIGPLDAPASPVAALWPMAAGLSLGAGAIHAAVMADHFAEYWLYGAFFAAAATFQVAWAFACLRWTGARLALAGFAVNVATIALWAWTRAVGLPIGPGAGTLEHVGFADLMATVFEGGLVAIVGAQLVPRTAAAVHRWRPTYADMTIARTFAILAIVIVTGAAIATLGGDQT